ncbi:MAG: flagellar hook-basal body complex protein FliE [Candidatus Eisenbacteria bacterium]|nr:flagellar hook-basal body complex protein FliE [Candidatus Eisenbacteria bacterium]
MQVIPVNVAKAVSLSGSIGSAGLENAVAGKAGGDVKEATSFRKILEGYVQDVSAMDKNADKLVEGLARGEVTDVHQVMLAVEEANMALDLLIQVRNKLLEAYQEISRTSI